MCQPAAGELGGAQQGGAALPLAQISFGSPSPLGCCGEGGAQHAGGKRTRETFGKIISPNSYSGGGTSVSFPSHSQPTPAGDK